MDISSGLQSAQIQFLNNAQNISSGNIDIQSVMGLNQSSNQFKTNLKIVKMNNDMAKEVLNIISPNKVDISV